MLLICGLLEVTQETTTGIIPLRDLQHTHGNSPRNSMMVVDEISFANTTYFYRVKMQDLDLCYYIGENRGSLLNLESRFGNVFTFSVS